MPAPSAWCSSRARRSARSRITSTPTPSSSASCWSPANTICSRSFATSSRRRRPASSCDKGYRSGSGMPCSARRMPSATNRSSCILPTTSSTAKSAACSRCASISRSTARACSAWKRCRPIRPASYGIVAVQTEPSGAQRVTRIVEKPKPTDAPSNLAVVGRYILTPAIFAKLERTQRGAGGEIQLTDGIASLLADEPVHVLPFTRYSLRLRQQDRLPARDRRVRSASSGARRQLPRVLAERLGTLGV